MMFKSLTSLRKVFPTSKQPYKVFKRSVSGWNENITAVLGAQWGDEGKGKLVDILASRYDVCCRFNGGANAGHTLVVNGEKYAMHLLPCGVLNDHVVNVVGNGVVVHVPTLIEEIQTMLNANINLSNRLLISDRAHITFDFHQEIDGILETRRDRKKFNTSNKENNKSDTNSNINNNDSNNNNDNNNNNNNNESNVNNDKSNSNDNSGSIGTTRRGIGPTYASKMYRNGIRFGDLRNWDTFEYKYFELLENAQKEFNFDYNEKEELQRFKDYRDMLLPMIQDTILYLHNSRLNNKKILIEGANAALLDIDFGTYPMVTSSSTTHGGISTGLGLASSFINSRIGVVKAYTTRVGHGPFPTEDLTEYGDKIQNVGHEYGTTTGRKRRCGWLDIPLLHYSNILNNYSSINITKLDVFDDFDEIKIATKYKLNGNYLDNGHMPSTLNELSKIQCEYEILPGWKQDISKCKTYDELPTNAKNYLSRIESLLNIPITWVGVGSGRDEMISKGFTWLQ